jgi:HAD superfamily hydrolase (TIGR01509 family)
MVIKLIVFDLDGVICDSREMHYDALNRALASFDVKFIISREEHLSTYDGLSTSTKLKMLSEKKGLSIEFHNEIWKKKQEYTLKIIDEEYTYDERIRQILKQLKTNGYILYVASNCVYNSVKMILLRKGFIEYIDYFISNEDVNIPKPSPEMYQKCMIRAGVTCKETVIVEDSHIGRKSAINSGAMLIPVENPTDVTLKKLQDYINKHTMSETKQKWQGSCNVVIPLAGEGSRFVKAGYTFPKPLIDVHGKPMIQVVVENLGLDPEKCNFIFIVRTEHLEKYNLPHLLNLIAPNCTIIPTVGLTEGAACSILLAKNFINNDEHLVLANSDQFMEWNPNVFMYSMIADDIDGGIATFENSHPKWSYAKLEENGFVTEVAEKKPISTHATTGIYYWKKGSDFVKYTEQMIEKNIRINNEFYTCPVFNEAIEDGKKIKIFPIERMFGLGTPEDLKTFFRDYHEIENLS